MIPDAELAMVQSHLEPMVLPASRYRADWLIRWTRIRDRFVSEDARIGTQCGDDRVAGGSSPHTAHRRPTRVEDVAGYVLSNDVSERDRSRSLRTSIFSLDGSHGSGLERNLAQAEVAG